MEDRWVAVSDRLPAEAGQYLVHLSYDSTPGARLEGYETPFYQPGEGWTLFQDPARETDLARGVTHWRGLPPPPDRPHD